MGADESSLGVSVSFTPHDIKKMSLRFRKLDKEQVHRGITVEERKQIPFEAYKRVLQRVMSILNIEGNGETDLKEFIQRISMKVSFRIYDIDEDGEIDSGELFTLIKGLVGGNLLNEQLQQVLYRSIMLGSKDLDGKINFEEFCSNPKNSLRNMISDCLKKLITSPPDNSVPFSHKSEPLSDLDRPKMMDEIKRLNDEVNMLQEAIFVLCSRKRTKTAQDLRADEARLVELNTISERLTSMGQTEAAEKIRIQIEDLNERFAALEQVTQEQAQTLESVYEVQRYHRDPDEIKLKEAYDLQRFLNQVRDLKSWTMSMMAPVSSDELAKDVTGTEALLERHKYYQMEIQARDNTFQSFEVFGHNLLQNNHFATDYISSKLQELDQARQDLERAWQARRAKLEQCLELQLFHRDCEQAEMAAREASLEDSVDGSGDSREALLKKHENFDRALNSQEEKIAAIEKFAEKLLEADHYDKPGVVKRRDEVLEHWRKLKEALLENRAKLGEAQSLQQFSREVDEMEIWITEKLQTAMDESYNDPSNIEAELQKHQEFESELAATADRIQAVLKMGEKLIDKEQCGGSEDTVRERINKLLDEWNYLTRKSSEKREKFN